MRKGWGVAFALWKKATFLINFFLVISHQVNKATPPKSINFKPPVCPGLLIQQLFASFINLLVSVLKELWLRSEPILILSAR
ncbi:hypothetical protein COT75_04550 [Candidatus Beckwithbacteria bacterium CG10_big_fil_rev_8_21_14_0_10_34_10]|uniref:Uncharacterized protein n=1 Tax=Candidatus Beckwithbacteria bacterium CG10_big_fil_rev_8_21_14_0_10_34_10 TaxID=1974495 RepID=A0A2H0WAA6_9BACT|nr:MAG: hypothetical protein COT75_04550 [Candidatus Beckwithbacteria bacterium CG10_big_fil_rev_8_21_14_0_10_34_10]